MFTPRPYRNDVARLIAELEYRDAIARWHGIEIIPGGGFRAGCPAAPSPSPRRQRLLSALTLALALAALVLVLIAPTADAHQASPAPATDAAAASLAAPADVEPVTVAPTAAAVAIVAQAERLALEYAGAHDWLNRCAGGHGWEMHANLDEQAGYDVAGLAWPELCLYALDADLMTERASELCRAAVHEFTHLIRRDPGLGWHPDEAGHPLDVQARPFAPCVALYPPAAPSQASATPPAEPVAGGVTAAAAKRAVRHKLGRARRWRLTITGGEWDGRRRVEAIVKAVRKRAHGRRRLTRYYRVVRPAHGARLLVTRR